MFLNTLTNHCGILYALTISQSELPMDTVKGLLKVNKVQREQHLQNPACSCQRFVSTAVCSHWSRTIEKVFPGTDRRVMPHQLPNLLRLPFFNSFTMTLPFQSFGTCASVQHLFSSHVNSLMIFWLLYFINSTVIQSKPWALLFFSVQTTPSASFSVIGPMFMFSFSDGVASKWKIDVASGWFSIPFMYSTQHMSCSSAVSSMLPLLSL